MQLFKNPGTGISQQLKCSFLIAGLCMASLSILAQSNSNSSILVKGQIFEDINNNGIKDNNEPGVKDVAVSDQAEVVVTDNNGAYQLNSLSIAGILFISVPSGYQSTGIFYHTLENK